MMLTGRIIYDLGIIKNADANNIQQVGVDVRVIGIAKVDEFSYGLVPAKGKTQLPKFEPIKFEEGDTVTLLPGYYELTLAEGCKVPADVAIKPYTRSSLVRMGGNIFSGVFDPGFETEHMGCFLKVDHLMKIEYGARVAQVVAIRTEDVVENIYEGQFQNDKQRK